MHAAELREIVRISFFIRILTVLVSVLGFVNRDLDGKAAAAIVFLSLTGLAGLLYEQTIILLQAHPIIVLLDGVVMAGLMAALGSANPLVIVTLSSCVVSGVVLRLFPAALSAVVLVSGYLIGTFAQEAGEPTFISRFALPVTFVCVLALSQAFRIVAQRKRESERAYAELVSSTATAQERSRIARELHDSTVKSIQGMSLYAQSLQHWADRDSEKVKTDATRISEAAQDAINDIRELMSTLRSDDMEQPFEEALGTLLRDTTELYKVRLSLDFEEVQVMSPAVRYEVMAAAREAVANAMAHSGAAEVAVSLREHGDDLTVIVQDQGSGFDPAELATSERHGHYGVRGYQERMELIGGTAEVSTSLGAGTTVTFTAPLHGLREETHGTEPVG